MRRSLATWVLLVSLSGCSSERVEAPPPVPADWASLSRPQPVASHAPTAKERMTAEVYVAALANPQLAALKPLFNGTTSHAAFGHKDARGMDGEWNVITLHEQLFGAFDQRKTAVSRVWRTEETQTVEWTLSGVQARDWLGVPASQKPVTMRGITLLWTNDDGSITDARIYFSVAAIKAELGVGPKDLQERAASYQVPPPSAPPVEKQGTDAERTNKQLVHGALDALEERKEAAYYDAFTDDVAIDSLGAPPIHGKDELKAYYKAMHKSVGQLDTTVANNFGIGDFAVTEYTISGENIGPGTNNPNADHSVRMYIVDVSQMRDGKIAHVWRFGGADF